MSKPPRLKTYGPYSPAVRAGNLVYTAGQVGAVGGKAAPDIAAQTEQALANLASVLAAAGSSLGRVVKTTVFLTDMRHFEQMNAVYGAVFASAGCTPARSCVAVAELPPVADRPLMVEIEAIALAEQPS